MEDTAILDLYWARDERAITETQKSYGKYCYSIANNSSWYDKWRYYKWLGDVCVYRLEQ